MNYSTDVEFGNAGGNVDFQDILEWVGRKVAPNSPLKIRIKITKGVVEQLEKRGQSADPYGVPAINQAFKEFGVVK